MIHYHVLHINYAQHCQVLSEKAASNKVQREYLLQVRDIYSLHIYMYTHRLSGLIIIKGSVLIFCLILSDHDNYVN